METKIIKIGTSLGMIVPGSLAKEYGFELGTKLELIKNKKGELVVKKKTNPREGWDVAFARYAQNGEDDQIFPDFLDSEAETLL